VPVWPTTKFRIGSVSKPLTAVALMQLVEAGKVDLDAPAQKYVPGFPDKGAVITVRMVAGHLAGIRHYKEGEFENQKHYANVLEGLKIFQDDPLVAPPGTKYSYSSYGYNLLSAVIESASEENFLAYMQGHIFTPLGLPHTTADQNTQIIEQRARFYELPKDGTVEIAPYVDNSYKWAGGGFLSTAEDLVRSVRRCCKVVTLTSRRQNMPNGFHGSQEEWARLEMPLLKLDPQLAEFALKQGTVSNQKLP
jgi:serine beta-lactamase-like protein LACTB, mitochondrial